jgi:midasin
MHASKKWLSLCSSLLEQCWSVWNTSEQLLQAKRAEEDSLYRYRTHKHVIQEEEVEEEVVRQMFPVYDSTFEEGEGDKFETGMGGEAEGLREMEDTEMVCPFTSKEMEEVCDLHLLLFAENTLGDSHRSSGVMSSKYSLAALLADIVSHIPGLMTDYCVIGGHALMCSSLLMELKCKSMGKKSCCNVYKEAVVWEAIRAEPIVSSLKTRVEELLMEWPNHPALVQIVKSCDKVLSLSVTDPLMKILSGLEYILRKAQDWEAYAASHVSLCTQLEALTQLILDWRRMELNSWRSLLAIWSTEVQQQSSKWWFHLHSLCQESVSTDHVNIEQLLVSVHQLVEGAPLGEFSERLNILDAFSKDMCIKGHSALVNILKNSELYYQQFLPAVLSQCDKVTAPVEKEFKEHVSIMRWNDGNYWALKASIEKSHRSLIKFMKKWKGVLQTPVRPLLTTCALTTISQSGGEKFHKGIENTHENISRRQISCTDPVLTDDQLRELSCVTVKEFSDSSENQVHLNANAVSQQMSMLLKEFSSSTLYYQWNTTLDELAGEIISTVEQLQSLEFLNGLEGEKRKNAVKLNSSKKRRAIQELLKCLKKQGLSYRKGMDFSRITKCQLFQLPVVQDQFSFRGIPEGLQSDIQKYFYCCLGRFAGLQAAFDLPTKDLPASQLKCCKGYAGHMITLLCQQRQTLSSYTHSAHVLQHLLHHVHSLISGELYTIQIAEYSHWQSELVTGAEISLELVSNFAELVATMPDQVDVSSCCDPPPILGCGDQSIAVTALSMLQADLPSLRVLRERLVEKEKEQAYHQYIFVAKSEMLELTEACAVLEHFCETVSKVLDVTLGSGQIRVGMLEFLKAAHSHLSTICQKCRCWVKNAAESVHCTHSTLSANVADGGDDDVTDTTGLLRELLMSVQRVITRHRVCATSTGEYKG